MLLEEIIDHLKQKGLYDLEVKPNGYYAIRANNRHDLFLAPGKYHGEFYMYAHVMKVSENESEKSFIFETILSSQLFQNDEASSQVGYDEASGLLVLFKKQASSFTFEQWTQHVQAFIKELENWQVLLKNPLLEKEPISSDLNQQLVRV